MKEGCRTHAMCLPGKHQARTFFCSVKHLDQVSIIIIIITIDVAADVRCHRWMWATPGGHVGCERIQHRVAAPARAARLLMPASFAGRLAVATSMVEVALLVALLHALRLRCLYRAIA